MTDSEIISIDEAIRHSYEVYYERDDMCKECREEHRQLAKWLEELKESRETISSQKAEIKRLREQLAIPTAEEDEDWYSLPPLKTPEEIKSEAIDEFLDKFDKLCLDGGIYPGFIRKLLEIVRNDMVGE